MGGIFSPPPPTIVQAPYQSATTGSTEIKPYAPVVPYIESLLPSIQQTFTQALLQTSKSKSLKRQTAVAVCQTALQ